MRPIYIVKKGDTVLLETYSLKEATEYANRHGAYVEWWATW